MEPDYLLPEFRLEERVKRLMSTKSFARQEAEDIVKTVIREKEIKEIPQEVVKEEITQ